MSNVEFFGRVAQKPAKVNETTHPFYTGKWNRASAAKSEPVIHEETRVRDQDLDIGDYE
jgi:hypothetical protein